METETTNKIEQVFQRKKADILSAYFTAGFPGLNDTIEIMKSLQEGGADLIEVGIPFSDPVADGPTIQESNKKALANGITLKKILEQVYLAKSEIDIPVLLMGYLNPVYQYGVERFCRDAHEAGVSGLIIPDLPIREYQDHYLEMFESHNLFNIFLVTPETSEERIREIDSISHGFIYMVAASSTTGAKKGITNEQITYFKRIKAMKLKTPRLVGFGISDNESFSRVCQYAQGAIIGSAIINLLMQSDNKHEDLIRFIRSVKGV